MEDARMPRGVPKSRESSITKMDAVRQALSELGRNAMPRDIQKHIRENHGVHMEPAMISNYKSSLKGGNKSALLRRAGSRPRAASGAAGGGFSMKDIEAVKQVVDKIGADKVQQLAQVLGK
jgi:hypothetical protein